MKKRMMVLLPLIVSACATGSQMFPAPVKIQNYTNYRLKDKKMASIGDQIISIDRIKEVPAFSPIKTFTPPSAGSLWKGQLSENDQLHVVSVTTEGDFLITGVDFPYGVAIQITKDGEVVTPEELNDNTAPTSALKARSHKNYSTKRGWMSAHHAISYNPMLGVKSQNRKISSTDHTLAYAKIQNQHGWPTGKVFKRLEKGKAKDGSFKAEIIYSGKVGSNVRAIYREYQDDLARPAFTQELTYNLAESDIIAYKSIKIKVLKSSNANLEYTVLTDNGLPWLPTN